MDSHSRYGPPNVLWGYSKLLRIIIYLNLTQHKIKSTDIIAHLYYNSKVIQRRKTQEINSFILYLLGTFFFTYFLKLRPYYYALTPYLATYLL
jgi:hypothetical protein